MAKKVKKLTRKELLQEDEFLTKSRAAFGVVLANKKYIGLAVALLVVLLVGIIGVQSLVKHKNQKALNMIASATEMYMAPVVTAAEIEKEPQLKKITTFSDDKTKYESALEKFQAVINKYPDTRNGILALYYAANCAYKLGRYDDAAEKYELYLNKIGDNQVDYFYFLAIEGLAYSYDSMDKLDQAIETYERLINPENKTFRERGLVAAANLYLRANNKDKALEYYKILLEDFPTSQNSGQVRKRVSQLESGA